MLFWADLTSEVLLSRRQCSGRHSLCRIHKVTFFKTSWVRGCSSPTPRTLRHHRKMYFSPCKAWRCSPVGQPLQTKQETIYPFIMFCRDPKSKAGTLKRAYKELWALEVDPESYVRLFFFFFFLHGNPKKPRGIWTLKSVVCPLILFCCCCCRRRCDNGNLGLASFPCFFFFCV